MSSLMARHIGSLPCLDQRPSMTIHELAVYMILTLAFLESVVVVYLLAGWKNAIERKIEALEGQLDDIQEQIMYIRRGMP